MTSTTPKAYILAYANTWEEINKAIATYFKTPLKLIIERPFEWRVCTMDNKPFGTVNRYYVTRPKRKYQLELRPLSPLPIHVAKPKSEQMIELLARMATTKAAKSKAA